MTTTQPCLAPQREQLFRAYPVCPRCEAEYLPLPGIDGCPWHMEQPVVVKGPAPWQQRPWEYNRCDCGEHKHRRAPRCRSCTNQTRGEATGYKTRCACGRTKDSNNKQCKHCRYPAWSARQSAA